NRVENELLPACVSVCPTECRIFGDLDDPSSEVAQIAAREMARVRKPEKGTIPKVFYLGAEDAVIVPEIATRPFIYKEGQVLLRPLGSPDPDPSRPGDARVDYDTPHRTPWGFDMALYLLTKGIATGTMLVSLRWPLLISSVLTTGYTGFLFAQGLARDLWQGWTSTIDLFAQAIVEGSAALLLVSFLPAFGDPRIVPALGLTLIAAMLVHVALIV